MKFFNSLIAKSELEAALRSSRGRGVKVGILDSGVASGHPALEGKVVENYEIVPENGEPKIVAVDEGTDKMEHGTACAFIIHRHAPEAELFSIRVLEEEWKTPTKLLVLALEFAIEQGWDVINLSLGNSTYSDELARLADRAYYRNQILVAAKDNKSEEIGWPAACASVLAVDMDHFEDPLAVRYHENNPVEVEAAGVYIECPKPDGDWESYTGTSFACPHVSAIAARLREVFPDLSPFELKSALRLYRKAMQTEYEIVAPGKFVELRKTPRGWEYAHRPNAKGAVAVLAITDDKRVILTEQFRPPVGKNVIELPAGLAGDIPLQEDEPLETAARRELKEETGYEAKNWVCLGDGPSSAGLSTEHVTIFYATGLTKMSEGGGDSTEDIRVHFVDSRDVPKWCADRQAEGVLVDFKIFAALYLSKWKSGSTEGRLWY